VLLFLAVVVYLIIKLFKFVFCTVCCGSGEKKKKQQKKQKRN
jgi:hypothetical protein